MICPKCKHEFKDPSKVKGGEKSTRDIDPDAQAKMQEGRKKAKQDRLKSQEQGGEIDE